MPERKRFFLIDVFPNSVPHQFQQTHNYVFILMLYVISLQNNLHDKSTFHNNSYLPNHIHIMIPISHNEQIIEESSTILWYTSLEQSLFWAELAFLRIEK